jgi:hypothetical protein
LHFLFLSALRRSQCFNFAAGLTAGVGVLDNNSAQDCAKNPQDIGSLVFEIPPYMPMILQMPL